MTDHDIARQCAATMFANDAASKALGISVEVSTGGTATARLTVTGQMLNGFAVCHGGHLFALADTAFAFACNSYDRVTFAAAGSIEFIRPAYAGDVLVAVATERSRGGRTGVYDVSVTNQDGDEVAVFRGRSYATSKPIIPSGEPK